VCVCVCVLGKLACILCENVIYTLYIKTIAGATHAKTAGRVMKQRTAIRANAHLGSLMSTAKQVFVALCLR